MAARKRGTGKPKLQEGWYDIKGAAKALGLHPVTVREAIHKGTLKATIPRGVEPGRTGRGQGYRIESAELQRWYFGK